MCARVRVQAETARARACARARARAVVHHRVVVRVLVVVGVVEVLEGVEEDAHARPVVLAAEDGPLDVVRVGDEPDRQTCARTVRRLGL